MKILMIDDNEADHFLTQEMMKIKFPDVEFIKALDGEQALEMLGGDDCNPDLILLDINMPRMNGHEFLEEYSEGDSKEYPVIVMLTSSQQERDKQNALNYKCVKGYMLKPLSPDAVLQLATYID